MTTLLNNIIVIRTFLSSVYDYCLLLLLDIKNNNNKCFIYKLNIFYLYRKNNVLSFDVVTHKNDYDYDDDDYEKNIQFIRLWNRKTEIKVNCKCF